MEIETQPLQGNLGLRNCNYMNLVHRVKTEEGGVRKWRKQRLQWVQAYPNVPHTTTSQFVLISRFPSVSRWINGLKSLNSYSRWAPCETYAPWKKSLHVNDFWLDIYRRVHSVYRIVLCCYDARIKCIILYAVVFHWYNTIRSHFF